MFRLTMALLLVPGCAGKSTMGDVMTGRKKKMAAALAAVSLYLQQEEAIAAQEQQAPLKISQGSEFSQWGQSGRQEMMAMRRLIQMRTFTRF
jgi:hypothetical protein